MKEYKKNTFLVKRITGNY